MKTHKRNLNAYYQMKEANLQRLPTIWFQLDGILKKVNLCRRLISIWWIHVIYTSAQTHRVYNTKSGP